MLQHFTVRSRSSLFDGGRFCNGFGLVMKQLASGGVALACDRCLLAANVCL